MHFQESGGYGCRCGYVSSGYPADKVDDMISVMIWIIRYFLRIIRCSQKGLSDKSIPTPNAHTA